MARQKGILRTFNRGIISSKALARTDLERTSQSAETMNNWMPRNLGSMMLRPGSAYLGQSASNNRAKYIPFVYANDDTALIEVTNQLVRVWESDSLVTRTAVTATITNGTFTGNITGWTDDSAGTGASAYAATNYLGLTGDGTNRGAAYQTITVNETSTEHALAIEITRGPVTLRVGSSQGADDYIAAVLDEGFHSLTLTPTGNFTIQFENTREYEALINSVAIESSGVMTITAPWLTADLGLLRYDQSGDIIFVACGKTTDDIGYKEYKIERRGAGSWSVAKYLTDAGPFLPINTTTTTITPSAKAGDITLTASANLFESTDVDTLFKLVSNGQEVSEVDIDATAADVFSDPIKVFGANNGRIFTVTIADRVNSTVTLQRCFTGPDGTYSDVSTYTADSTFTYDDTLDNQEAWYRIGVKTADYGTDAIDVTLSYPNGNIEGTVRITAYSSATSVSAITYNSLGGTDATVNWYEGRWSDHRGHPTEVMFIEGRLAWFGRGKVDISVSDDYYNFDTEVEGDSGTISRTIGSGPTDKVNWAVELDPPVFGTDGKEHVIRASSQNEILTPSNASVKGAFSTQGSAKVIGQKLDDSALYVQKGGNRLMQVVYDVRLMYTSADLSRLYPESGGTGIEHIAVQRQPDTRIHCLRNDGTVALLVFDAAEEIACWVTLTSAQSASPDDYYDMRVLKYTGNTIDVSSDVANVLSAMTLSKDGTKLLVANDTSDLVYQFTLSTAFDISTATVDAFTMNLDNVNAFGNWNGHMEYSDNGQYLYLHDNADTEMYAVDLGAGPWTLQYVQSSLTKTTYDLDTDSQLGDYDRVKGFSMSQDGKHLYVLGDDSASPIGIQVHEFSLDTAYDISTLSYVAASDAYTIVELPTLTGVGSMRVFPDGLGFYIFSTQASGQMWRFSMSTAWDITTASYTGVEVAPLDYDAASAFQYRPYYFTYADDSPDAMYVYARSSTSDEIYQWQAAALDAVVEDIVVLPGATGSSEDAVYYSVKRTINGSTVRYLERFALESECIGGTTSKNMDAHVTGTVAVDMTMSGLDHLEGELVTAWVNGVNAGKYVVSGGTISDVSATGSAVVGLYYKAQFKSTKLGDLIEKESVARIGIIAENMHYQGLTYGPDFDNLDPLPGVEEGWIVADNTVHTKYDAENFSFDGYWNTDNRICLEAESPKPVTLLALTVDFEE